MRKLTKNKLLFTIVSTLGIIAILSYIIYGSVIAPKQKISEWQNFKNYTNTFRLPNQEFIGERPYTIGCFKGDVGHDYARTCRFTSEQYYLLQGNYKDNARQILATLKRHGYEFKSENSKWQFESHVNNSNTAGDLSNSTPLSTSLINKNSGIVVGMQIIDKKRLSPNSLPGITPDKSNALSSNQLIASLNFTSEY